LENARRAGIAELFLKVQEINQNAVNFYFSNGFRVVGSEAFRVGATNWAALVMRLALREPAKANPSDVLGSAQPILRSPGSLADTMEGEHCYEN